MNNRPKQKHLPSLNSSKSTGAKTRRVALPFFFINAGHKASCALTVIGNIHHPHPHGFLSAPIAAILLPSPPTPFSMAVKKTLANGSRQSGGCVPLRQRLAPRIYNDFFTSPVTRLPGPGCRNYAWPWLLPTPPPVGAWSNLDALLFCPPGKKPSRPWSSPPPKRFSRPDCLEELE